jgi:hypothetical protein
MWLAIKKPHLSGKELQPDRQGYGSCGVEPQSRIPRCERSASQIALTWRTVSILHSGALNTDRKLRGFELLGLVIMSWDQGSK